MNTLKLIKKTVFNYYDLDHEIIYKTRKREVVTAHQMYYLFSRIYTQKSLSDIGKTTKKDHATVIYGIKHINNIIETEKQYKYDYHILNAKMLNIVKFKIKSVKRKFRIEEVFILIEMWKDYEHSEQFKKFYETIKDIQFEL